jgi:hypothetical protein
VQPAAERLRGAAAALAAAVAPIVALFELGQVFAAAGPSRDQLAALLRLALALRAPSLPPAALLRVADWQALQQALAQLVATGRRHDEAWRGLSARWQPALLGADLDRLAATVRAAAARGFLLRWWQMRGPRRELAAFAVGGRVGDTASVRADLDLALQVRADRLQLQAGAAIAAPLGPAFRDGAGDWQQIEAWLAQVQELRTTLQQMAPGALQAPAGPVVALANALAAVQQGDATILPRLAELVAGRSSPTPSRSSPTGTTRRPSPRIETFAEAGVLTMNKGLVVRIGKAEFQITIVRSR